MDNREVPQGARPNPDAKRTIEDAINPKNGRLREIQVPGHTPDQLRLPSRYGFISGGAVEKVKLIRDEVTEAPLVSMTQTDFNDNSEHKRAYEFTFLALDKGNLVSVGYGKDGRRKNPEIIGPWKERVHSAEELGIYRVEDLPPVIDEVKVAMDFLGGVDKDTFAPPVPFTKPERIIIQEYEPGVETPIAQPEEQKAA